MRFAAELVSGEDLDLPSPSRAPSKREVDMAARLVDSLHARFKADEFSDEYRDRVTALIESKARGEEPAPPEPVQREESGDLMAALEASLAGSGR
jgi:DNA end-binding protein Ku